LIKKNDKYFKIATVSDNGLQTCQQNPIRDFRSGKGMIFNRR